MHVIGLLGGIASGKSTVARHLLSLGARLFDADVAGHEVLRQANVKQAIRQRWGDSVFDNLGEVSRPALAAHVFTATPEGRRQLEYLEHITHPEIHRKLEAAMAAPSEPSPSGCEPVLVLDAPILLRAHWDQHCDHLLFVDSPRPARLARAMERGWTEAQFSAREAAQETIEEKRRRATWTIDNSGSVAELKSQVTEFWRHMHG